MKRKKGEEGGSNWMDTYGDMVTLLLCFFVLLYSMSSVDQQKWEILVRSFNPDAVADSQIVTDTSANDGTEDVEGVMEPPEDIIESFDELYYSLVEAIKKQGMEDAVEINKGDGFTFITFRDSVFFKGDSYVLTQEGKDILDSFAEILSTKKDSIGEIEILGHTSQASPTYQNNVANDRFLASNRATIVLVYLQQKNIFDPSKLVASSYGQFRPIATFETPEGRSKNRRVEILITRDDAVVRSLDDYYQEVYQPVNQ